MRFQNNHEVADLDTGFDIEVEDILGLNLREAKMPRNLLFRPSNPNNEILQKRLNLLVWNDLHSTGKGP